MKTPPELLTKEEMDALLTAVSTNEFYNLLFNVAKKTGRRLGEFYGVEIKEVIGEKETKHKKRDGTFRKVKIFKATGVYEYGVKWKDIIFNDDGSGVLKVWVLKRRNYIQDETILTPDVTSLLKKYYNKHRPQLEDYTFRKKSYRQIQQAVKTYSKKAGIKKNVMFHSFRHYFITHLLRSGWNYNKTAKLTGHKNPSSLSSYDHVVAMDLKEDALIDLKDM